MKILSGISFSERSVVSTLLSLLVILAACNKVSDQKFISYKEYAPLQPGKYFIYEIDSTITTGFGEGLTTRHYLLKDSVIDIIYDDDNKPSLKIFRYIKADGGEWTSIKTVLITPQNNRLEYREDNLHYTKMVSPVSYDTYWPGNSDIPNSPFYDNDISFDDWQFAYTDIGVSKTFNGITYPNTVTIVQYDSASNEPFYPKWLTEYHKGYEVYAEGVGMVYKDILGWEYQVTTSYSGCKHLLSNGNGKDTLSINCNLANCDSIINQTFDQQIINCDTNIINYQYQGKGVRETLIEHN